MRIQLFISAQCPSCAEALQEIEHIRRLVSIPTIIYTLKRHLRTGELIAVDEYHNMFPCPDIPGVPAILFGNKLFVGDQCGQALRKELAGYNAVFSAKPNGLPN